ncbi:hypothetical protein ACM66B_000611 [Microbotryomycetes sp. NB124-2]
MEAGSVHEAPRQHQDSEESEFEYSIEIVQQPVRARMVGLGDKDRRPISPPVIVKLVAHDKRTHQCVDPEDIDTSFLIMAADLRSESLTDANLVVTPQVGRSRTGSIVNKTQQQQQQQRAGRTQRSPSLQSSVSDRKSSTGGASVTFSETSSSLVSPAVRPATLPFEQQQHQPQTVEGAMYPRFNPTGLVRSRSSTSNSETSPRATLDMDLYEDDDTMIKPEQPVKKARSTLSNEDARLLDAPTYADPVRQERRTSAVDVDEKLQAASMPNLIGSLHANAFKLKDEEGRPGIYFILSDLSVRTEGQYRLRVRLFEIGASRSQMEIGVSPTETSQGQAGGSNGKMTEGSTGVAAAATSQTFSVMTAKKFAGMLEPSALSRCFAKQGVRIPTRSSARRRKPDDKDAPDLTSTTPLPDKGLGTLNGTQ